MLTLEPKDKFALNAASGWLMLNNPTEALREIHHVQPELRDHPEVLLILWDIHAHQRDWETAILTADRLVLQLPNEPDGSIKRAYALHELKRTQEAWDTVHPISERFPKNWLIPYNLACYAAQLGRPTEALDWFRRALRVGDKRELRDMALNDPDLQPIRAQIEKISLE